MILRSRPMQAEIELPDACNIKPLIRALAQDGARYEAYQEEKKSGKYSRPVFGQKG